MPKVTHEMMRSLFNAGVFPPRHPRGCPKNYARTLPMLYLAKGLSIDEIRAKVKEGWNAAPCTCKDVDVCKEW